MYIYFHKGADYGDIARRFMTGEIAGGGGSLHTRNEGTVHKYVLICKLIFRFVRKTVF